MSPSRRYDTLDERVANKILELHEKHPNLGHNGLYNALEELGVVVDPQDLERFMEHADIEGESWYWKRNNIRGYLKILGFAHDDPLKEPDEYVN
jgi:hypothetical protein